MTYMNTPGIHDYADVRSHKFYKRVYVGEFPKEEQDSEGYRWMVDNVHPDLKPTATTDGVCEHCNRPAFQTYKPTDDKSFPWKAAGYVCVCKGAQDELHSFQSRLDSLSEAIAINEKLCQNSPEAVRDFYRNHIKYLTEQYRAVLKEMEGCEWMCLS